MNDRDWSSMSEKDFDAMLEGSVSETPPEDVVEEITPWKKAMNRVLTGMALCAITLNFLCLNYILPAVGIVLQLLGFRALRRENKWFNACFAVTIIRAAYFFPTLVLNTTIFHSSFLTSSVVSALTAASVVLMLAEFVCLWQGLRAVKAKVGLPPSAKCAAALIVWYALMGVLPAVGYEGVIILLAMVVAYICIIRNLYKLSGELDEAGYSITPQPVKVTDKCIVIALSAIVLIGCVLGYVFGSSYAMDWREAETAENSGVEEIKDKLLELGFPEYVLNDLTPEDIAACEGALRVVTDVEDIPADGGRTVTTVSGSGANRRIVQDTVYDKKLRMTGVAVQVSDERERWIIFHHFLWLTEPGFYGTEAVQLWPTYTEVSDGWAPDGEVSGRVLYDSGGKTFAAPYRSLRSETYDYDSVFFGIRTRSDVFASFSVPRNGENCRGYVAYATSELADDYIISSWINYVHQQSWLQYPAMTAEEYRKSGFWDDSGAFRMIQNALQFYPSDDGVEMIS